MEQRLLTIADFVSAYRTSRSTVYREFISGRLRRTKIGARTYIAVDDAENWLKAVRDAS
jgi:hypothetical protein